MRRSTDIAIKQIFNQYLEYNLSEGEVYGIIINYNIVIHSIADIKVARIIGLKLGKTAIEEVEVKDLSEYKFSL